MAQEKKGRRQPLYKSFVHAFEGIAETIRSERNIKIHCGMALLVVKIGRAHV